ncbi:MAG: proteasome subunit beta [Nanoarchaeota archaeon]|nr:proteasome subunit beta [Nanoarchaeota archaeon]
MNKDIKDMVAHGTTTVGLVCKEGIILAADRRASAGYFVADKKAQKIQRITDYMAITTAGLVSDTQLFTRIIRAQLKLLKIRKGKEPTVEEASNLLASLAYVNIRRPSMVPGIVGFLLGGMDKTGFGLYEIGVDGSTSKADDYKTDGSGSYVAVGVLETLYKKDMTMQEGIELAVKALNAAMQRDIATGNGIDVLTITKDGVKNVISRQFDTTFKA